MKKILLFLWYLVCNTFSILWDYRWGAFMSVTGWLVCLFTVPLIVGKCVDLIRGTSLQWELVFAQGVLTTLGLVLVVGCIRGFQLLTSGKKKRLPLQIFLNFILDNSFSML